MVIKIRDGTGSRIRSNLEKDPVTLAMPNMLTEDDWRTRKVVDDYGNEVVPIVDESRAQRAVDDFENEVVQ
jgi:hypothetical protein